MKVLISFVLVFVFVLIGSPSFAATPAPWPKKSTTQIQKDINQDYKELLRLYKQKAYNSYLSKSKDVMVKLNDANLPLKYRQKMSKKVSDLNVKLKAIYNQERLSGAQETGMKKRAVQNLAKPAEKIMPKQGQFPETLEGRQQETQALRAQILKDSPQYRNDADGLAQRVMEHKIRLARERQFLNEELTKGVDRIYEQAVGLFSANNFEASQEKFAEVEKLIPGYKKTREYLRQLEKHLVKNH